jgi:hypothetical protein
MHCVIFNVGLRFFMFWESYADKSMIGTCSTRIDKMSLNIADFIYESVPGNPVDSPSNLLRRRSYTLPHLVTDAKKLNIIGHSAPTQGCSDHNVRGEVISVAVKLSGAVQCTILDAGRLSDGLLLFLLQAFWFLRYSACPASAYC